MASEPVVERRNPDVGHEPSDIRVLAVTAVTGGILLGTLIIVFLLWFLFAFLRSQRTGVAEISQLPERYRNMSTNPVLQRSPDKDLESLNRKHERELTTYTWSSPDHGTVAIPIDRAMAIVAEKGLPPAQAMPKLELGTPRTGHRQTGSESGVVNTGEAQ